MDSQTLLWIIAIGMSMATIVLIILLLRTHKALVRFKNLANIHPVSGLPNRHAYENHIRRVVERINRNGGSSLALIHADMNAFKHVNDTYGHAMGDELLRQFGNVLRSCIRPTDAVFHTGGDEFMIVCVGGGSAAIDRIARKAYDTMRRMRFVSKKGAFSASASFGGCSMRGPGVSVEQLSQAADEQLYAAKELHRRGEPAVQTDSLRVHAPELPTSPDEA